MYAALLRAVTLLAGFCLLGGCAAVPTPVESYKLPVPPRGIVLVADGAGGYPEAFQAVTTAVEESGTPLYVRSFDWTHGQRRGVADLADVDHARAQGRRLAAQIAAYRSTCPQMPIYLVAFSAGTHVALEATRWLPPDSLQRVILLAPAVSADYDLRPALAASRQGVDAFCSARDRFYLGFGTRVVGTADGKQDVPAAGRVGFAMPTGPDLALAQRLRQHPWDPSIAWTGNTGNHSGSMRPAYFRAFVLPLLIPNPP